MDTPKPSSLLYQYLHRYEDLERIEREKERVIQDMRDLTEKILKEPAFPDEVLCDPGISVGLDRLIRYRHDLRHTTLPLVVMDLPRIPIATDFDHEPEPGTMLDGGLAPDTEE